MKITAYKPYADKIFVFDSVREAVHFRLEPNAYSYDGQIEKLQCQVERLQEVIAILIDAYVNEGVKPKIAVLREILNNYCEVEE